MDRQNIEDKRAILAFGIEIGSENQIGAIYSYMRLPVAGGSSEYLKRIPNNVNRIVGISALALTLIYRKLLLTDPQLSLSELEIFSDGAGTPAQTMEGILKINDYGRSAWFYNLLQFEEDKSTDVERRDFISQYIRGEFIKETGLRRIYTSRDFPEIQIFREGDTCFSGDGKQLPIAEADPLMPFSNAAVDDAELVEIASHIISLVQSKKAYWVDYSLPDQFSGSVNEKAASASPETDLDKDLATENLSPLSLDLLEVLEALKKAFGAHDQLQSFFIDRGKFALELSKGRTKFISETKIDSFDDLEAFLKDEAGDLLKATSNEFENQMYGYQVSLDRLIKICMAYGVYPSAILDKETEQWDKVKLIESRS